MTPTTAPRLVCIVSLGIAAIGCSTSGGETSEASATDATTTTDSTSTSTETSTTAPTTSASGSATDASGSASATGTTSTGEVTTGTGESESESETEPVDPSNSGTTTSTSTDSTGTGETTGESSSTGDETGTSTGDDTSGSSSTGDTGCVPSEAVEVTCDDVDNDCDGLVDNVDVGQDGICDCLDIVILGSPGFAPNSNFEAWLEAQGSSVTRTSLLNNPDVVTPAFLAGYDLVLVDRIERGLAAAEAAALEAFVKDDGRGIITLIGYNFDNDNPAPERDRANTVLTPFGLAYVGGYFGNGVIPTFDQNHPVSQGIVDVNLAGGIEPQDVGNQGTSDVFATWQNTNAGIAHQTAAGGRVIVWGDEWITFDSDWVGYADVEDFWVNMVDWARPQDICILPM